MKKIKLKITKEIIIAGFIFLAIVLISTINFKSKPIKPEIVLLGDSIIANDRSENSVTNLLCELSGMDVFNGAFGGTTLSISSGASYVTNRNKNFSLVSISKGIKDNDFGFLVSSIQNNKNTELDYFNETATGLNNVNFKTAKYIVIEHGANDYLSGVMIQDIDDPYNEETFIGALRVAVENIKKGAPKAQIIIVTPCYNYIYKSYDEDCRFLDFGGGILEDYVNAEINFAEEAGIAIIDNYHDSVINEDTYNEYLHDGLHTNSEGNRVIAEKIWNFICRKNQ